jgi:hypothetical protein
MYDTADMRLQIIADIVINWGSPAAQGAFYGVLGSIVKQFFSATYGTTVRPHWPWNEDHNSIYYLPFSICLFGILAKLVIAAIVVGVFAVSNVLAPWAAFIMGFSAEYIMRRQIYDNLRRIRKQSAKPVKPS